jgi:hypothetical protein
MFLQFLDAVLSFVPPPSMVQVFPPGQPDCCVEQFPVALGCLGPPLVDTKTM